MGYKFVSYKIVTYSATIQRSIQALLQKDVIDVMGQQVMFVDPAFQWWFKRNFV